MPKPKPAPRSKTKDDKTKTLPEQVAGRPVLYPEEVLKRLVGPKALTEEQAVELIGWITDPEEARRLDLGEPFATDLDGRKVWGTNNMTNRPFTQSNAEDLRQKLLNKRWAGPNGRGNRTTNGEPMIIGATGLTLNCQHRLYALVTANQEVRKNPDKWKHLWPDLKVVMDTLVVFGVEEIDEVVNTMDTCKSRSLTEVIYRCPWFRDMTRDDRLKASAATEYAVRVLWDRTGERDDAYAPRRNHDEAVDLINRHPRLLEAVRHLQGENKNKAVTGRLRIGVGTAAGLAYLMGTAASDPAKYKDGGRRGDSLDFKLWKKAMEFWTKAADQKSPECHEVRMALAALVDPDTGELAGTGAERVAILVKAWGEYAEGRPVTEASLRLEYEQGEDTRKLLSRPACGGIDLGPGGKHREDTAASSQTDTPKPAVKTGPAPRKVAGEDDRQREKEREVERTQEWLMKLRKTHPGKVLLFRGKDGFIGWGKDADTLAEVLKLPRTVKAGMARAMIHHSDLDKSLAVLVQKGRTYVLLEQSKEKQGEAVVAADQRDGTADAGDRPASAPVPAPSANGTHRPAPKPRVKLNPDGSAQF